MNVPHQNKKVLLYVGATDYAGGPQLNSIEVGKVLTQAGAHVTIASLTKLLAPDQLTAIQNSNIKFINTPFAVRRWGKLRNIYALASWIVEVGPRSQDVVVCMGYGGFHFFLKFFIKPGGMLIHRETGAGEILTDNLNSFFYRYIKDVDGVLALSKTAKFNIDRNWPINAPIRTIPEIVPDTAKGFKRTTLLEADPLLRVGYLGRLENRKGVLELISIWPELQIKPAILRIHGHGTTDMQQKISEMIEMLGLENEVFLKGSYSRADLYQILSKLDMVVLLSKAEGLPTVLIEAASFGVPFVATDVGCTRDLTENNLSARVVPDNANLIKNAIEELADKIRAREINTIRLQEFYKLNFGFEAVAQQWQRALLEPKIFWCNP